MRPLNYLLPFFLLVFLGNSDAQITCESVVTNVTCNGMSDGTIDLTVANGQPPYTFQWQGPNGYTSTTEDIAGLATGTYLITVTDENNETCENQVSVNEPDISNPSCDDGDCSTLDTYNSSICECVNTPISPPSCDDNDCNTDDFYDAATCGCENIPIAPPSCDDNDCNTIDIFNELACQCVNTPIPLPSCDDNDCTTEDSFDVATCNCIHTPIDPQNLNCDSIYLTLAYENVGDQVRIDFPFDDFEMITSFQFSMNYDPTVLELDGFGQFNLGGLSELNFTNPFPGKITVNWADLGAGTTLSDGTSAYSIYFNPLSANESLFEISNVPTPIEFFANAIDPLVVEHTTLTIVPDPSSICVEAEVTNVTCFNGNDGCIDLTPIFGAPPYTFQWSNGSTTPLNCNLPVGIYTVTVEDVNLETCIQDFTVGQPLDPLNSNMNLFTFECAIISLQAEAFGGVPDYDYLWSDGSLGPENFDVLPGLNTLTITDAVGCITTSAFFVPDEICDSLEIQPVQATVGNQIRIDFEVENFNSIIGLEHIVFYDESALQFDGVGDFAIPSMDETHFDSGSLGNVLLNWEDIASNGFTLNDGSVLYSLYFTSISNTASTLSIGDWPVLIQASNDVYYELISEPILVYGDGNFLSGTVYFDENTNCNNDGEAGFSHGVVSISNGINIWNVVPDANGAYTVFLQDGNYVVSFTPYSSAVWAPCESSFNVELSGAENEILDIGVQVLLDCPVLEVDVAIPILRRCFLNAIHVNYCNYGSITAENAYIDIALDPFMALTLTANSPQPDAVNGNTYTYELGDVAFGECGSFLIYVELDPTCTETDLGQTHCVTGTIYPNDPCEVHPLWSGASLNVSGSCDGTNVNFVIENVGENGMNQVSSFIVIEDQVMGQSIPEDFILGAGESITITHPANGSTYRVILNQVPYHPGNSTPSVAVEGCGVNDNGEISLGMVTMFNAGEGDGFEDIECLENIGSYDPNDKRATVSGFSEDNLIYANEQMEYIVRFQNTGTDTAFNIVIRDELSPNYEITSIRPGASSHAYTYSIEGERTMVFTFENIMLPDSTADLENSQGFISYKVDQLLDNPDGTILENRADIYFDFNPPILTNTTHHEIGSDFITTSTFFDDELKIENAISVYPNPSTENITFELDEIGDNLSLEILDITGRLILTKEFDQEKIILSKDGLTEGMYFYSINQNKKQLASGKFIFL